jgi:hypothetical protein
MGGDIHYRPEGQHFLADATGVNRNRVGRTGGRHASAKLNIMILMNF